jgi:coenzyme F420-reducing hydrogenase alpha subunit
MSSRTITIDPITRLEGHGKIEIFLNEEGNVENAYFQVPELRGFERFCEGRKAEDLPILTPRICGVCPVAHHFASTKALDAAFNSPAICISIRDAAKAFIHSGHVNEGLLNRVEMAFRAYDPCLACATHFAVGQMPLQINIYSHNRKLLKTIER